MNNAQETHSEFYYRLPKYSKTRLYTYASLEELGLTWFSGVDVEIVEVRIIEKRKLFGLPINFGLKRR